MDLESLLPTPPAEFKRFAWPPRKRSKLGERYRSLLTGYRGGVHAIWTCDNPASNAKVLEVLIRIYDNPRPAQAQFNPVRAAKRASKRIGLAATVTEDGSCQFVWNRGNIHFLEIGGNHEQAFVSCEIAAIDNPPHSDAVASLYKETIGKLPRLGTAAGGIPPLARRVASGVVFAARQVTIGVVFVVALILARELTASFLGDGVRLPVTVALIFLVVLWFTVIPPVARSRAARRASRYGSVDEGIPLALASVGVTFPTENDV